MYLNMLKSKEKKELFLDLCVCLSESDGDFSQAEKNMIRQFCQEMGIEVRYTKNYEIDEILDRLNGICDDGEKRAVVIETVGIVLADEDYSKEEREILIKVSEKFDINYDEIEKLTEVVKELYEMYGKFSLFLNGKKLRR